MAQNDSVEAINFSNRKISYPASERNKSHILQVLKKHFQTEKPATVLEIASGTGQHASFFAGHFPNLIFQPSEYDSSLFDSIKAYARETKNVREPIAIDITTSFKTWNLPQYDYMINVNMTHITPYKCTVGLFENTGGVLKPGGLLVTYGPYMFDGKITPQSNVDFDRGLKMQNPEWGLRDVLELKSLAEKNGIKLLQTYDLPSNNKCLVWANSS